MDLKTSFEILPYHELGTTLNLITYYKMLLATHEYEIDTTATLQTPRNGSNYKLGSVLESAQSYPLPQTLPLQNPTTTLPSSYQFAPDGVFKSFFSSGVLLGSKSVFGQPNHKKNPRRKWHLKTLASKMTPKTLLGNLGERWSWII